MPQIEPLDGLAVNRKSSGSLRIHQKVVLKAAFRKRESLRMRFLTTKFLKPKRSRFTCMKASKNETLSVITTWHAA